MPVSEILFSVPIWPAKLDSVGDMYDPEPVSCRKREYRGGVCERDARAAERECARGLYKSDPAKQACPKHLGDLFVQSMQNCTR